jgi:putative transposase
VRARLAHRAADWRWSSARAHLSGRDDAIVAVRPLLERVPDWRDFLEGDLSAEAHEAIRAGEQRRRFRTWGT